jgi:hypothetical protein
MCSSMVTSRDICAVLCCAVLCCAVLCMVRSQDICAVLFAQASNRALRAAHEADKVNLSEAVKAGVEKAEAAKRQAGRGGHSRLLQA